MLLRIQHTFCRLKCIPVAFRSTHSTHLLTVANSLTGLQLTKMGQFWSLPAKPQITHVIFDLDGTLIDTEDQYFKLHAECLRNYGKELGAKEQQELLGQATGVQIKKIVEMFGLKSEEEYRALYESNYSRFLGDCPDLPGANKLIQHLYQSKIPMAICTNTIKEHIELKTKDRKWLKMIPLFVLAPNDPEVKRSKPFPDSFLVTMKRFETKPTSPKNVLIFEDSLTGATAALDSGATVIMIPQESFSSVVAIKQIDSLRPRLSAVLKSMPDFKPEEYGLPPFN